MFDKVLVAFDGKNQGVIKFINRLPQCEAIYVLSVVELSFTEIILLSWAGLATGMALHYRQEDRNHRSFVTTLIEHKGLRAEFFDKIDTHNKEHA
jgi:hypothetical protein